MSRRVLPGSAILVATAAALAAPAVEAQQWSERIPGNAGEWNVRALRPRGQPVLPIFDGWILEADGTASLCLGYYNLNFDEALEIPIGPNNYIEPAEYNGLQPTYFNPVPLRATNKLRHYCVFSINVPAGGERRIVWHLRRTYDQDLSVPAHSGSIEYRLDDVFFPTDRAERGGSMAPIIRFVEPRSSRDGISRGLRGNIRIGPVAAKVGEPLTLTLAVRQPTAAEYPEVAPYVGEPKTFTVSWSKYSGPPDILGIVTFSENEIEVTGEGLATTAATFTDPGRYVLITQTLGGAYDMQCCWTNGYVEVDVTR
jgi:hypothetical protein